MGLDKTLRRIFDFLNEAKLCQQVTFVRKKVLGHHSDQRDPRFISHLQKNFDNLSEIEFQASADFKELLKLAFTSFPSNIVLLLQQSLKVLKIGSEGSSRWKSDVDEFL